MSICDTDPCLSFSATFFSFFLLRISCYSHASIHPLSSTRHISCCYPEDANNGGWTIFNAILGWNNTATIGTLIGYAGYWATVSASLTFLKFRARRRERSQAERNNAEVAEMWEGMTVTEGKGISEKVEGVLIEQQEVASGDDNIA